MNNQIEIDNDVFGVLKSKAEPFVDTPNSVLRRLLGLDATVPTMAPAPAPTPDAAPDPVTIAQQSVVSAPAAATKKRAAGTKTKSKSTSKRKAVKRPRAARGTLLPEDRYEGPLLRALVKAGGQAPYRDVVDAVGAELKDQLMPADFETLDSGSVRWQSRLQFVRLRLIQRGYLDRDTPRGIWGITDQGRSALNGS